MIESNTQIKISKPEIERVQKEKQEYKLIGRWVRTKGLKLWAYNSSGELKEVDSNPVEQIELDLSGNHKEFATSKAKVNSNDIHFEALNRSSALKRIDKWKSGKLKQLSNLKEKSQYGIKLF